MRNHSLISAIWKSFYDQSLYQDVKDNWGFGVVAYLLLLVILYVVIFVIHEHDRFNLLLSSFSENISQQVPTGALDHGIMKIDQSSPYSIYFVDKKNQTRKSIIIFDMHNQVTPNQAGNAQVIFHNNGYFYNKKSTEQYSSVTSGTQSFEFQTYPSSFSLQFSPAKAKAFIDHVLVFIPFVFFMAIGLLTFVFKLCQPILYAFIVMIFGGFCKLHFTYGEAYRLAIVATTPAFILIKIPQLFIHIPHPWLIAFILELIYLYFAAYANCQANTP